MAVTISAPKYFTGTGPIKFSEIRDTFGEPNDSNFENTMVVTGSGWDNTMM